MIADYKKTSRTHWAGAMLLLVALACMVLTNAYVAKADFEFSTPTNLGPMVNSPYSDGTPSISADGLSLYFNSQRPGGFGDYDLWIMTRATIFDPWGEPENLGPKVNSPYGDGGPIISANGLSLYFGSNRPGGYGGNDIWVTTRATTEDDWGEPVNIGPSVNSSAWDAPGSCIDGLTLFIDSSRPGGSGGQDLWVSTRATINDPWGNPVNLGPIVNSSDFDAAAVISFDGLTLFFMSGRPGGYGGFDGWITRRATKEDAWGIPMNLGPMINTSDLDGCACLSPDGFTLYFMSGRSGGYGSHDLWQVSILPIVDFNGDGNIDTDDLLILINSWGKSDPLCDIGPTPLGDGIVNMNDLEVFMRYWEQENIPQIPQDEL